MRLLALALLLIAASATTAAAPADRGPGLPGVRQGDGLTWQVADFDRVAVGTAGTVEVKVGPAWSLRIAGPAEALANLHVVRRDNRLEIGRRWDGRPWTAVDRQLRVAITLPRLTDFAFGGSGRAAIDRVTGPTFEAAVGGSGAVTIGELRADRAEVSLGGSGSVTAAGRVGALTVNVGGSGHFRGQDLRARSANVSAAGSGSVVAAVAGPAQVSAVGSGSVDLGPAARCTVSRIGSTRVRCAG